MARAAADTQEITTPTSHQVVVAVVVAWAVSRVLCALIVVAASIIDGNPDPVTTHGFVNWDSEWYVRIAREGYGAAANGFTSYPFFPLLPALLRGAHEIGLSERLTGVVLSHLAFLVALFGVHRIARRRTSERAALLAVWTLALFPSSLVFSTPYPSSLFLAGSVWAFLLVEDGHDVPAAALVAGLALLRPNGIVVGVALLVAARSLRRAAILVAPGAAAFLAWMLVLRHWTGDSLVFLHAKAAWVEVSFLEMVTGQQVKPSAYVHLLLGVAGMAAVALARRHIPPAWQLFAALYLIPSLGLGIVGLGRYANECFPVFVAAGLLLEEFPRRVRAMGFALSTIGLGILGGAVAAGRVVP